MKIYIVKRINPSVPSSHAVKGFIKQEKAISFMKQEAENYALDAGDEITEDFTTSIQVGTYPDHHKWEIEPLDVDET